MAEPGPGVDASASPATIWDRARLGITVGSVALIFLAAIEALAVTTVMPIVSDDLHGEALYAVAFSGTLATGVIGMVAAGVWSDRTGPRAPLYVAVILFLIGLVISGVASDMYTFLAGRMIQGLGVGGQIVSLYVLVARMYPRELQGKVFAAYAAAWVVPSMIGPFLAGAVAEFLHWRWVFLGVAVLSAIAFLLVITRLRGVSLGTPDRSKAPSNRTIGVRLALSVVVAAAAVGAGFGAEASPLIGWTIALGCIVLVGLAIKPLVPPGTLSSRAGLPSVILLRGLVAGAFFAAEAYIPKLLIDEFEFSPTIAGAALTAAALSWSLGSFMQGQYGDRLGSRRIIIMSIPLLLAGVIALLVVALSGEMPWLVVVGWGVAGAGMGFLYPRLTVLTLAYSTKTNEGFNSSALSISDSSGAALTVAVAGLAFLTLPTFGSGFATVFIVAAIVLVVALMPGPRMGDGLRRP